MSENQDNSKNRKRANPASGCLEEGAGSCFEACCWWNVMAIVGLLALLFLLVR